MTDGSRIAARLRAAVSQGCGFTPRVMVLDHGALKKAMDANPFDAAAADPRTLHLFFLERRPHRPDIESLNAVRTPSESFALKGSVLYLHTPDGFGRSTPSCTCCRMRPASSSLMAIGLFSVPRNPVTFGVDLMRW